MTFWQDARPAAPWFPRPRPRAGRGRTRWWFVAVVLVLAAGVGLAIFRGATGASAPRPRAASSARGPRVVPAEWSAPRPDESRTLLADRGPDVVVVGSRTVALFRARDGARRWEAAVPGVQADAALDRSTVLVAADGGFVALERGSGRVRWRTRTPEPLGPVALLPLSGMPGLAVVATEPSGLAGLDRETGSPTWSVRLTGRLRGTPVTDPVSGTLAGVWQGSTGTELRVIDAASGRVRWAQPIAALAGSPVVARSSAGALVIVGAGDGRYASTVRAFALEDGRERWHASAAASFQPGLVPLVDGDDLYVLDQLGTVKRLDLTTGRQRWRTATGRPEIRARPVLAEGAVLVPNDAGEVFTLDATTGRVRARRLAAGVPVGLAAVGRRAVLAQRLVPGHGLQGFAVSGLATAGRPE
jgi:outer membrane protein assembly factor BamB